VREPNALLNQQYAILFVIQIADSLNVYRLDRYALSIRAAGWSRASGASVSDGFFRTLGVITGRWAAIYRRRSAERTTDDNWK